METNDIQNFLFKECNLNKKEDIFNYSYKSKNFTIIKKSGIEKIISHLKIDLRFEIVTSQAEFASVKAIAEYDGLISESYGSAFAKNCTNNYYLEMAEKRAMSRVILRVTKLSLYGFKGEDEIVVNQKLNSNEIKSKLDGIFV